MTSGAFWFYINAMFFPNDLQDRILATSFEEWVQPIMSKIQHFSDQNHCSTDNNFKSNN